MKLRQIYSSELNVTITNNDHVIKSETVASGLLHFRDLPKIMKFKSLVKNMKIVI